jgi:HSP20 family protein
VPAYFYFIANKGFIPCRGIYAMGIARYMAREIAKELDSKSREFYEFVMPAIDIVEEGNELVVTIDLPGFAKKDINLRITDNVLTIKAKKEATEDTGTVYQRHRPSRIEKKILLPLSVKEDEKVVGKATYADGVVTLRIPMLGTKTTNIPVT